MAVKAFQPTVQDKQSVVNELVKDIKLLTVNNKEAMKRYLDIKADIKKFRADLNSKALQECFFFVAGHV